MPPRTIVANPSAPSNTLSFALPPGVSIDVESVLAAIDATAAGPTTALLEIADSSGAVIARKAQTEKITGGITGSATWALRLADSAAAAVATADLTRLYAYTLPVAQTTIDTAVDGPNAGPFPQTFAVLEVWLNARSDNAGSVNSLVGFTFNGDTGNHYDLQQVQGIAGVVSASSVHNSGFFGGDLSGDSAAAGALRPGVARFSVADYAGTVFHKAVEMTGGMLGTATGRADFTTAVWHPTLVQGITSVRARALGGDKWKAGSSLYVYARK